MLLYFIVGWIASLLIGSKINALVLGENVAKSLGQNTVIVKLITGTIVILLAGGSVAVAGPVGFIGIVIPHIARWFVGNDYRWLIPYSAMLGAILLLIADIIVRYVAMPSEIPVGVMPAIVGTPFFIYLARKGGFQMKKYSSLRVKDFSLLVNKKALWVTIILIILFLAVIIISIGSGDLKIGPVDVIKSLFGTGSDLHNLVVRTFRLPRILLAVFAGAGLAVTPRPSYWVSRQHILI